MSLTTFFPFLSKWEFASLILTDRTRLSFDGWTSTTCASWQELPGKFSSHWSTMSPIARKFPVGCCHFQRWLRVSRYSWHQRIQNWLARYWTLYQLLFKYKLDCKNSPDGETIIFLLWVKRWLNARGLSRHWYYWKVITADSWWLH